MGGYSEERYIRQDRASHLDKRGNTDTSLFGQNPAMELDAFNFVQSLGGEVTLSTMGATDDGHVFDDQRFAPLP